MSGYDSTPIIVGVGQCMEQVPEDLNEASSHVALASRAAMIAMEDTGAMSDSGDNTLAANIDTLAAVRTFADSSPAHPCPFGGSSNFPRSVGARTGINPEYAIYGTVGGQTPQAMVEEFAEKLHRQECRAVLLVGAEVIANIKAASRQNSALDWHEEVGGQLEDRGLTDGDHLATRSEFDHQVMLPIQFYGLMEQARRAELNDDMKSYRHAMAETFAGLSRVAAGNPHAQHPREYATEELLSPENGNRTIVSPYPKRLVANDNVNQAAALIMTTVGKARELGIPEQKWVYLHGYANTKERTLLERPRIGYSQGMEQSILGALAAAGKSADHIAHLDIYSCFPIVVNLAKDILGIEADDSRSLTQTGGLPYFGAPGNNYSTHGIVSMVETLRADPGSFGLVYANGGWMSKHATGVYSTEAPRGQWTACDSTPLQRVVDSSPVVPVEPEPNGEAILESYLVNYMSGKPVNTVVIGRLKENNRRFYAVNAPGDAETMNHTLSDEMLGKSIYVAANPQGNRYAYHEMQLAQFLPEPVDYFEDQYEFCKVERDGRILKVTINRPEMRNALHPEANQELENIFNAYEKDKDLWVAIVTGAGEEAFSAGNDLKYMASGGHLWVPKSGFAGLTSRVGRVKPIIAAVNGAALGGGLEIAMACDLIVAADHAVFGLPEVKVGLFAGMGGVQRLSRQIGLKPAMEIMLTGAPIDCDKALSLGLINYAVPLGDLMETAESIARLITQAAPVAVRSTMQLLNETSGFASIDDAVNSHHNVFDNLLNSEDFYEGSRAFAAKRKPRWTGR